MATINFARREIEAKIVYCGPALSGKTTNLRVLHELIPAQQRGELHSLATDQERTLFFDYIPIELGQISGFAARFKLFTVPGQAFYRETRRVVLEGADAVVFVADSAPERAQHNVDALVDLEEHLSAHGLPITGIPLVVQLNKRDAPGAMSVLVMQRELNPFDVPIVEAIARTGQGVLDTLYTVTSICVRRIRDNLAGRETTLRLIPTDAAEREADAAVVSTTLERVQEVRPEEEARSERIRRAARLRPDDIADDLLEDEGWSADPPELPPGERGPIGVATPAPSTAEHASPDEVTPPYPLAPPSDPSPEDAPPVVSRESAPPAGEPPPAEVPAPDTQRGAPPGEEGLNGPEDEEDEPVWDTSDPAVEASVHAAPEPDTHAALEADTHAALEADTHAASEGDAPAAPDADTPAAPDADTHAAPEADTHAVPEADAHAAPQADTHAAPEPDAHAVPEADAHAAPEVDTHAAPEPDTHAASEADAHAEQPIAAPSAAHTEGVDTVAEVLGAIETHGAPDDEPSGDEADPQAAYDDAVPPGEDAGTAHGDPAEPSEGGPGSRSPAPYVDDGVVVGDPEWAETAGLSPGADPVAHAHYAWPEGAAPEDGGGAGHPEATGDDEAPAHAPVHEGTGPLSWEHDSPETEEEPRPRLGSRDETTDEGIEAPQADHGVLDEEPHASGAPIVAASAPLPRADAPPLAPPAAKPVRLTTTPRHARPAEPDAPEAWDAPAPRSPVAPHPSRPVPAAGPPVEAKVPVEFLDGATLTDSRDVRRREDGAVGVEVVVSRGGHLARQVIWLLPDLTPPPAPHWARALAMGLAGLTLGTVLGLAVGWWAF